MDGISRLFHRLGGEFWAHVGYPNDSGGDRPVYHGPGVMDSTVTESTGGQYSFRIMHRNDVISGQSGGPFFVWWDCELTSIPRASR